MPHLIQQPVRYGRESDVIRKIVPIIIKQFVSTGNGLFGVDANPMLTINQHDSAVAIRSTGMVGKSRLVPLACGVDASALIQVEQEAVIALVVYRTTTVSLLMRDHLSHILVHKIVLL